MGGARTQLALIDTWENAWFPVAKAALAHHHPEIEEQLFLNLTQTGGPEVIVSVGTFVRRLEALAEVSAEGAVARQLPKTRGLDAPVVDQAKELLDQVRSVDPESTEPTDEELADERRAEDAMWQWYLEWSTIARATIKNGNLLRRLGFRKPKPGRTANADAQDVAEDAVDAEDGAGGPAPATSERTPADVGSNGAGSNGAGSLGLPQPGGG